MSKDKCNHKSYYDAKTAKYKCMLCGKEVNGLISPKKKSK